MKINKKTIVSSNLQHNTQYSEHTSHNTQSNTHHSRGITLVALVVTIVVLLILAGITITLLFSDNGIITKAQRAKEETENSATNELEGINSLGDRINSIIDGSGTNSKEVPEILLRYMLGENKTGILATEIIDLNNFIFIDNDIIPDASTSLTFVDYNYSSECIYAMFLYDNERYIVSVSSTTYQTQEVIRAQENKIYEGQLELTNMEPMELTNLAGTISRTNLYLLNLTVDGEPTHVYARLDAGFLGPVVMGLFSDDVHFEIVDAYAVYFDDSRNIDTVILNSIYDLGLSNHNNYVEEYGFSAYYLKDIGKWRIVWYAKYKL